MKFSRNQAAILALCIIVLLMAVFVAFQGQQNQPQNGNATNPKQNSSAILGQQNQTPGRNITGGGTAEAPGWNAYVPSKNMTNETNITCSDTEGTGEYYFIAGTTTGSLNGIQGPYSDYCAGNVLHYYMCAYLSAGPVVNGTYACSIACSNGACTNPSYPDNCADSDGGANPYLQGTATSPGAVSSDSCTSNSSLMEYYCLNGIVNGTAYNCTYGCSNGACTNQTNGTLTGLDESDFMIVDDSLPNLLASQKLFELPPPPGNNT